MPSRYSRRGHVSLATNLLFLWRTPNRLSVVFSFYQFRRVLSSGFGSITTNERNILFLNTAKRAAFVFNIFFTLKNIEIPLFSFFFFFRSCYTKRPALSIMANMKYANSLKWYFKARTYRRESESKELEWRLRRFYDDWYTCIAISSFRSAALSARLFCF